MGSSKPNNDIVEINVEVPAPAFVALRNLFDFEILTENVNHNNHKENLWLPQKYFADDSFENLVDSDAVQAAAYANITPSQIQIAYELFKLESLLSQIKKKEPPQQFVEEMEKKNRLMVKKRLNVANKDLPFK